MAELQQSKEEILADLDRRVADRILEPSNAKLLKKLINQAESLTEAIQIAELGTTYKRTGLHFDKRLDKLTNDIRYFKRNAELSFTEPEDLPKKEKDLFDGNKETQPITHKLIIGDNYDALLNLLIQYHGQIDVIYIDPPYGKDSMGEFAKTNYENALTRDNLLSMLYPRLVLAKQLLSDRGVIFCSIDDRNQAYVKCLFDEVFEERNFIANVIWNSRKSVSNDAIISLNHNHTFIYSKDFSVFSENKSKFKLEISSDKFSNPDNDPRGAWVADPFDSPGIRPNLTYEIVNPNTGEKFLPPKGRCWRTGEIEYKELFANKRIVFGKTGNSKPQFKRFLSEADKKGKTPTSIWDDVETTTNGTQLLSEILGEALFSNPKPVGLIKRIVDLGTDNTEHSIILDFFAGSGTTGQAVLELNASDGGKRQFILCTNNEITDTTPNGVVRDVTSKRLKRVMTGTCYDGTSHFDWIKKNKPLGGNLDVYDMATVADFENTAGKTPFDVIDETLYGQNRFQTVKEKTEWVINHFEGTQKSVETEAEWRKRVEG